MGNPGDTVAAIVKLLYNGVVVVCMKNILGEMITKYHSLSQKHFYHSQEIDLRGKPKGIYFLEITLNGKIIGVKKLMKD